MTIDVMARAMTLQVPTFPLQSTPNAPRLCFHTCILMTRLWVVKRAAVYPRVCGGTQPYSWRKPKMVRLSPHARG